MIPCCKGLHVYLCFGIVMEQAIDKNHSEVRILLATHKDLADKPAEILASINYEDSAHQD